MRKTGSQTRIGTIVPKLSSLRATVPMTRDMKERLKWVDFYHAHGNNARLTCRHYGIHHRTFYRYYERFTREGVAGLASLSHRPKHVRTPTTPRPLIALVSRLRRTNPEYSKYKVAVILKRDYGYSVSASTIGRIITRHSLFFAPPVKPKKHPGRRKSIVRLRKPKDFTPRRPGRSRREALTESRYETLRVCCHRRRHKTGLSTCQQHHI